MAYATKYRIEFETIKLRSVKIDIQEDGFGGSVTEVKGAGAELNWPDGDKSKVADVRSSSLRFQVYTDTPTNFIAENATTYKVLLYFQGTLNWSGWLDTGAINYRLQDGYQIIELNAKDGLHLLEESDFRDLSGEKPYLFKKIAEIISYCLNKTELGLDFNVWLNIFPEGYSVRDAGADPTGARDPFNQVYISTRTFQTGEGEYDSPYTILQKICASFKMTMFQARGQWHFVYVEDWIRGNGLYGTRYNSSASPQSPTIAQFNQVEVGLYKTNKWVNNDALVSIQDNLKKVRINYAFDVPASLIRNIDFNEGDFVSILALVYAKYDLDGWTTTGAPPFAVAALSVSSDATYEKERFLLFIDDGVNSSGTATSSGAPINKGDFFTVGFKYSHIESYTPNLKFDVIIQEGVFPFTTKYLGADGKWKTTQQLILQPNLDGGGSLFLYPKFNTYNLTNVEPIPFTGSLQLKFTCDSFPPAGSAGTKYQGIFDLTFNYDAYIGEAGQKYATGHYYDSFETFKTKSTYQDEIYLSDALNIVNSGALVNSNVALITNWFHQGVTESVKFGRIICRALWKIFYRNFYRLEAAILNIYDGTYLISPLNTILPDAYPNKEFQITTLRVDLNNELGEGTFVELQDSSTTDDFDEVATNETYRLINVTDKEKFAEDKPFRTPPPYQYGAIGFMVWAIKNRKSKKS